MEIIGVHAVTEALKNEEEIRELLVIDKKHKNIINIIALAEDRGIKIREDRSFFDKYDKNAQGVCVKVEDPNYLSLDELLDLPEIERKSICVLDSIQDVGNLGAIIRSASVFGVDAVILPKDRSAKITPTVYKTSQGGLSDVKICMVTNLSRALRRLKDENYWVAACHMEGDDVKNMPNGKVCFIIGNESTGIRPNVLKEADFILTIPMSQKTSVGCLNASCAASIFFYNYFIKEGR